MYNQKRANLYGKYSFNVTVNDVDDVDDDNQVPLWTIKKITHRIQCLGYRASHMEIC